MKWSYRQLQQLGEQPLQVDEKMQLEKALQKARADILAATPVQVQGLIGADRLGAYSQLQVETILTMPSTRSLLPAEVKLSFLVSENYVDAERTDLSDFSDKDLVIKLDNNLLDLEKVITDNILLQIPMQILTPTEINAENSAIAGRDWQVLSEEQLNKKQEDAQSQVDPRLEKLAHFFDDPEE